MHCWSIFSQTPIHYFMKEIFVIEHCNVCSELSFARENSSGFLLSSFFNKDTSAWFSSSIHHISCMPHISNLSYLFVLALMITGVDENRRRFFLSRRGGGALLSFFSLFGMSEDACARCYSFLFYITHLKKSRICASLIVLDGIVGAEIDIVCFFLDLFGIFHFSIINGKQKWFTWRIFRRNKVLLMQQTGRDPWKHYLFLMISVF